MFRDQGVDVRMRRDPLHERLKGADHPRHGAGPRLEPLLRAAAVKVLASERGVTVIEVQEDRLMLTRNNDYVMVESKFPRLIKKQASARLKEIKRLLAAL